MNHLFNSLVNVQLRLLRTRLPHKRSNPANDITRSFSIAGDELRRDRVDDLLELSFRFLDFSERLFQSCFRLVLLSDVHRRPNVLEVARLIPHRMRHNVAISNGTVRQEESMFEIQIRPALDSVIECRLHEDKVLRMNPLEYQFECWFSPLIDPNNSIRFV